MIAAPCKSRVLATCAAVSHRRKSEIDGSIASIGRKMVWQGGLSGDLYRATPRAKRAWIAWAKMATDISYPQLYIYIYYTYVQVQLTNEPWRAMARCHGQIPWRAMGWHGMSWRGMTLAFRKINIPHNLFIQIDMTTRFIFHLGLQGQMRRGSPQGERRILYLNCSCTGTPNRLILYLSYSCTES